MYKRLFTIFTVWLMLSIPVMAQAPWDGHEKIGDTDLVDIEKASEAAGWLLDITNMDYILVLLAGAVIVIMAVGIAGFMWSRFSG